MAAAMRFLKFFAVTISNPNTRRAYMQQTGAFLAWCDAQGLAQLAGIRNQVKSPLFRTTRRRSRQLTRNGLQKREALNMVKRRIAEAGLPPLICNHSFRATGITAYLEERDTIEHAQAIAAHESPRTTKPYDRRSDRINQTEIERIRI